MLFCYPVTAVAENWIHECLVDMISASLDVADSDKPLPAWPNCVPPTHRDKLKKRTAIRDAIETFHAAVALLTPVERQLIRNAISVQNNFPTNLASTISCIPLSQLPTSLHAPVSELARAAFDLLSSTGVRDRHYSAVYKAIPNRVCPFCGFEYFDAPGAPRHDLDHYIPLSKYPFAGANLRNLSPMGDRCNSSYKGQKDILVDSNGQRRPSFDPYGTTFGSVSLVGTQFFSNDAFEPKWVIDLGPAPEAATWDSVWDIRERYCRDVLNPEVHGWLAQFGIWCNDTNADLSTPHAAAASLEKYIRGLAVQLFAERAFLKKALFEVLLQDVSSGPSADRATRFLQEVTKYS